MKTHFPLFLILLTLGLFSVSLSMAQPAVNSYLQNPYFNPITPATLMLDSHLDSIIIRNDHDTTRLTFSIDPEGKLLSKTEHKFIGSAWVNNAQTTYTYTANDLLSTSTDMVWMNASWENIQQCHYAYDNANHTTSILKKDWVNNTWLNVELSELTYDTLNGRLTSVMVSNWDNAAWDKVYLTTYSYDANGNTTEEIRKNYENNAWENAVYVVNGYDNNGNLLTTKHLLWINSSWNNTTFFQYLRDPNGNCTNSLRQVWDGISWLNANQSSFTYDPNGNCLEGIYQNWFGNAWVNASRCQYGYTPGHISGTAYQWEGQWNPGGYMLEISRFQNGTQVALYSAWGNTIDYYCSDLTTGISEQTSLNAENPAVYPNPARGSFSLSYFQTAPGFVKIQLYALTGELIRTLYQGNPGSGIQNFGFNTKDLPEGIYLLVIRDSGKKLCKKLTLLH